MIVAISGTPGTGKTAVGRLLAKRLGFKFVELNSLAEKQGLYSGFDKSRKTKIVDVERVKKAVASIEGDLVIESHYAHDIPNDITVVLRCEIGELRKRLEKRGWDSRKVDENIESEIFGVCLEEAIERGNAIEIDTTGRSPGQVVAELRKKKGI